jgi:hypothetical protein
MDAVVFDPFGTLVYLKQHRRPFYKLLKRMGHRNFQEARRVAMSYPSDKVHGYLLKHGLEDESWLHECVAESKEDCQSACFFAESVELLQELRQRVEI